MEDMDDLKNIEVMDINENDSNEIVKQDKINEKQQKKNDGKEEYGFSFGNFFTGLTSS